MGFSLRGLWEGADFWDKEENKQQAVARTQRTQAPVAPVQTVRAPQQPSQQPSYGSGFKGVTNKFRDVFDANTAQDYWKRNNQQLSDLAQGKIDTPKFNQSYEQQQRDLGAKDPARNIVEAGADMLVEGVAKPVIRTSMAYSQAFGNLGTMAGGGKSQNAQEFYGKKWTDNTGYTGTKQQVAGDLATNVLNFAVPGTSGAVTKTVSKVLPKATPSIIPKMVSSGAIGTTVGGASQVANLASTDQPLTKENISKAFKQGTIYGGAFGATLPIAGAGTRATTKLVKNTPEIAQKVDQRLFETPQTSAIRDTNKTLQRAWDNTSDVNARRQISQQIARNNQELSRQTQIGAVGKNVRGGDNQLPLSKEIVVPDQQLPKPTSSSDLVGSTKTSAKLVSMNKKVAQPTLKTTDSTAIINQSPQDTSLTINNNIIPKGMKERGLTKSVKNSPEVSNDTKVQVSGAYTQRSTQALQENSDKLVTKSLPRATKKVNENLAKKTGTINDQDVADAITVAKAHDAKGNFDEAQNIYDRLAEHGTKGGQQIQAFSLLSNRTPEGMKHQAYRSLKKAGIELDQEGKKELDNLINAVKKQEAGSQERNLALHDLVQFVSRKLPTSSGDKAINIWRAGLLTAPTTTGGNVLGNTTEAVTKNLWVNPVSTVADQVMSLFTGQRTKTMAGGYTKGLGTGVEKAKTYLQTGFDERNPMEKYDGNRTINYDNKFVDKYVNGVYRWMGGQDQPFYYGAKSQATKDLAKADAINLGLSGQKKADYIAQAEADPNWKPQTFKTKSNATKAGEYAVYQNETALGKSATGLKKPLGAVGDFLVPFARIPASVAMRIIDRTPVGIAKEMVSQASSGKFDQRAMAEAIGNGTFGVSVVFAGYSLGKNGLITGGYPQDQKEAELWKLQGKQPYSVKVGNRWLSLNYMQPFGTLLAIGHQASEDKKNGKTDQEVIASALGTAGKSIENQSFLQGINGILSAVNDPERSATKYVTNTASSIVPNFIRAGARASDPYQRDAKGVGQGIQSAIPVVNQRLPVKQDAFGKPIEAKDNPLNIFFNPTRPSVAKTSDPLVNELQRLQDTKNGIIPTQFTKTSIKDSKLTDNQVRELQAQVGSKVYDQWNQLIKDPRYAQLSDPDKATALKKGMDAINEAGKLQYSATNNLPFDGTKASEGAKALLTGGSVDPLEKSLTQNDYYKTRDAEYKDALSKYESDKKEGKITDVQDIKRKKDLKKLEVGSGYDKNVRDLYNLSKAEINDYVSKNPDAKNLTEQLLSYDQKLKEAGLTTYLKFKNGLAPVAKGGKKGRKGGRTAKAKKGKKSYKMFAYGSPTSTTKSLRKIFEEAKVSKKTRIA